jgi:hypothetical protein
MSDRITLGIFTCRSGGELPLRAVLARGDAGERILLESDGYPEPLVFEPSDFEQPLYASQGTLRVRGLNHGVVFGIRLDACEAVRLERAYRLRHTGLRSRPSPLAAFSPSLPA